MSWRARLLIFGRCVLAGACICASLPPWGWWPLVFPGVALWDQLLAGASWKRRFRRSWLVGAVWFYPSMLWMYDLTPPGYVVACAAYAAYFGVAAAVTPPGRARWIALPGAIVLAEFAMWNFPFGGVPLANLALSQADAPLAQAARLFGPLLVVALVVVGGIVLSALWERQWKFAAIAAAVVVLFYGLGVVAPKGHPIGDLRIAVVQGGGPQRTRAATSDPREVFQRHVDATRRLVQKPVDLIVWPENVVAVTGRLEGSPEYRQLQQLAKEMNATMIVGVTEDLDAKSFLNASIVFTPDGKEGERFDKVRTVPFGEFVPLRGLIEKIAGDSGLPARDAVPGTGHGVLHTPVGNFGTVISWEVFFDGRARDAIGSGGEVLLNPTNGSSYWLTEVQTQQVASSRLRAIETGRWVAQAAPTGFSVIVDPNGKLASERSNVSETKVIEGTVERRDGDTIATLVGPWVMVALSFAAIAVGWYLQRRTTLTPDDVQTKVAATGSEPPPQEDERVTAAPSG